MGRRSRQAPVYRELAKTEFEGYSALKVEGAQGAGAGAGWGGGAGTCRPAQEGEVVLDATSFYADSGGQVGDVGWLYGGDHQTRESRR